MSMLHEPDSSQESSLKPRSLPDNTSTFPGLGCQGTVHFQPWQAPPLLAPCTGRLLRPLPPPLPHLASGKFHATGANRYSNDYMHAEHMDDITGMKNRKLKMGLGVFGALGLGIMVPIWAVQFQMKKQGGGI